MMSMVQEAIKAVLKNNSRVIIPDIGAIILDDDANGNIFFSEYIKFDDDTILDELVKTNSLSKTESKNQIETYIVGIKRSLDANTTFEIEGLGFIQIDDHGKTVFNKSKVHYNENDSNDNLSMEETQITNTPEQPQESINNESETNESSISQTTLGNDDFANHSSNTGMIETEKEFEDLSQEDQATSDYGLDFGNNEYQEIQRDEPEEDPHEEIIEEQHTLEHEEEPIISQKAPNNKSTLALIITILLISGVSGWYFFLNGDQFLKGFSSEQSNTSQEEVPSTEPSVEVIATSLDNVEETTNNEETMQQEEVVAVEDNNISNEETQSSPPTDESNNEIEEQPESENASTDLSMSTAQGFCIIMGSFQVEANANKLIDKLVSLGHNVNKFEGSNGGYLVGYNNLPSRDKAEELLLNVKEVEPDAWIKTIK